MVCEAKGDGWAVIKDEMLDKAKEALSAEKFRLEYEFWLNQCNNAEKKEMLYFEQSGDYNEDEVLRFLNCIKPFITEGSFKFTGEEGEYWKFQYIPKTDEWKEFPGMVFYTPEDLWNRLTMEHKEFLQAKIKELISQAFEM